ncbi:tryptophan dimethylallyltransferase family protein [Streptomyces sp. NPDC052236]|uniref:tryptophan dimethylallyltransferase family protein n=1 Tax=Streptomyces sp. NPDC052236 TaxID=3365686 RepID=UPI0037D16E48
MQGRVDHALISAQAACAARLDRLTRGLGLGDRAAAYAEAFRVMTSSWGAATPQELAESDVSSDGSPMEFAVGFDDTEAAVQFAVEPMRPGDSPRDRVLAARHLMRDLVSRYRLSDRRWSEIADLFLPEDPAIEHVSMYGAEARRGAPVEFKVWFYPAVLGDSRTAELCERGLERLGLGDAWPAVVSHMRRDEHKDRPMLFSLDLSPGSAARVKLYFRHYDADADYMSELMAGYPGFLWKPVLDFCTAMTANAASYAQQPPVTCLSFTEDNPGKAGAATLYLPMWTYAPDDAVVRRRFHRVLAATGRRADQYDRALNDVAGRPLESGRGIHNYVAWRPGSQQPRLKVYLSPELRRMDPGTRYEVAPEGRAQCG